MPATIAAAVLGHYGVPGSQLVMSEAVIATAWNLQGEPSSKAFMAAAERISGMAPPILSNTAARGQNVTAFWLGPSSWLLIAGPESLLTDFGSARDALNAVGGALFDVTASRIAFVIAGVRAPDVLASGCPLDFHRRVFAVDACQQSVFGRVPALFYRRDDAQAFTLLVARSFARDTWQSLCAAAGQHGYTVAAPQPW